MAPASCCVQQLIRLSCRVLLLLVPAAAAAAGPQVFSFKLRGAFNKMAKMPQEALQRGVITSSAGNHAQGVALAAAKLVSQHSTAHSGRTCSHQTSALFIQ